MKLLVRFKNGRLLPVSLHVPFMKYVNIVSKYVFFKLEKKKQATHHRRDSNPQSSATETGVNYTQ